MCCVHVAKFPWGFNLSRHDVDKGMLGHMSRAFPCDWWMPNLWDMHENGVLFIENTQKMWMKGNHISLHDDFQSLKICFSSGDKKKCICKLAIRDIMKGVTQDIS